MTVIVTVTYSPSLPLLTVRNLRRRRKKMETRSSTIGPEDALVVQACCSLASKAHSFCGHFLLDKTHSSYAVFAFPGSWSVTDWFTQKSFGVSKVNRALFPSLKRVGTAETAVVNESFLRRFEILLGDSNLQDEVKSALGENRKIVFTGHSSGGAVAIFATIWLLEHQKQLIFSQYAPPSCLTFGSPLVGDQIFGHAVRRENWSHHFLHFITRRDIVPRISLAPFSSIEQILPGVLCFFNPKSAHFRQEGIARSQEAAIFLTTVLRNAASLTTHAASLFMGSTNLLLKSLTKFAELSPYKPFGTYIFCTDNGKMIQVKNPDAVLQMFFHCLQLNPEEDITYIASISLQGHLTYEQEMQKRQEIVYLDNLEQIPLSTNGADNDEKRLIDVALNELELSTRARICLRAAQELEKQTFRNQDKIESNIIKIEEGLNMLQRYRSTSEDLEIGYYDAFKSQRQGDDFNANIKRLELAGMWDEIVEMLWRYGLPDDLEGRKQWVDLGTKYRRLVEPLDIANYYRHNKNDDTGPYMIKGRPMRYRLTQRWLEYASCVEADSCSESCFWAEVEELYEDGGGSRRLFDEAKERVLRLEKDIERWVSRGELSMDVFLEESTLVKWWNTLPDEHKARSCIAALVDGKRRNLPPLY